MWCNYLLSPSPGRAGAVPNIQITQESGSRRHRMSEEEKKKKGRRGKLSLQVSDAVLGQKRRELREASVHHHHLHFRFATGAQVSGKSPVHPNTKKLEYHMETKHSEATRDRQGT